VNYLLDTNVLAEVRKPRGSAAVRQWMESVDGSALFISVLVLGEIQQGIDRLARRDPRQAAVYSRWLSTLRREFADHVLPVTEDVALAWGRLNSGDPIPVVDGLMAATARVAGLTLVTRNVAHVERTGVSCLNPFDS
jgi:predicted nucleic acid-binding protein